MAVNIGTGIGTSVLELVDIVSRLTDRRITVRTSDRRSGDAPVLTACTQRATEILGFTAVHSGIEQIVQDALNWTVQSRYDRAE